MAEAGFWHVITQLFYHSLIYLFVFGVLFFLHVYRSVISTGNRGRVWEGVESSLERAGSERTGSAFIFLTEVNPALSFAYRCPVMSNRLFFWHELRKELISLYLCVSSVECRC